MGKIVITNNPLVMQRFSGSINIEFYELGYIDILKKVRDKIHKGYKLLTHPLMGSVKPNETPYRSIVIEENNLTLDINSVMLIESSIVTAQKFLKDKNTPKWNQEILEDFQTIDLSLIEPVIINYL